MNGLFDIFLRRPRLVVALSLALIVAGVLSVLSLSVAFYPSVARPTISVSCTYPGANAREVMNTVAGPLEDQVNGVEGFDHMTSSCADTGAYGLTVYFQAGFDRDLALMKVQAAVQQALTQLPQEVKNTGVTVGIGQTIDLGLVTLYSDRGELTRDEVVDYVFAVVDPAIKRVSGIGATSVMDDKTAMRIWLDSDRMTALGIGSDEVVAAIRAQNVQASLGSVGGSPTADSSRKVISLVAKGRLQASGEFGAIIVRTMPDGGLVYLRDIAKIELGHEQYSRAALFGDKPACVTQLYQLPGANTLETVAKVKALLAGLEKRFPGDLKWDMTVDVSRYSTSALRGAQVSFLLAAVLAFVVLLAVYRSVWAAVIPLAATLVALSVVLTVMAVTGCFVTVLSLYALTAALVCMFGVSSAVLSACRAGRLAATRLPVLATGASVSAASLVLMLVSGVQGLILRQFATVFAATGVATALVAVTVVPVLSLRLRAVAFVAPVARPAGDPVVSRVIAVAAVVALLLGASALVARMPQDLVPNEDFGVVLVDVKTRDGTSRPQVVEIVRELRRRIAGACAIEKSCTVFGEGIFSPSGENVAKMYLVLKPWSARGPGESTLETIARIRDVVSDIPEAQVSLMTLPTVPGMGTAAYVSPLLLSTADNDPVRLAREARRLQTLLKRSPLADDVTCGYNTDTPHLRIHVDRAKCETMKVPLSSLFTTLQHYLGSIYVNDINLGTQVNRVTVMSDWKGRSAPEAMAGLYVRATTGAMVPVSALVDYGEELGPNAVYRYNRYLYCTVDMAQRAGVSLQDAMDEISRVFARELPRDYDTGWSGIAYEESSNPGRLALMVALALAAVFLILMVRFESWRRAAGAMLPSAAAVFGGVFALYVTGVPLSLYSRFALVMLVASVSSFALFTSADDPWRRRAFLPLLAAIMVLPLVFTSGAGAAGSRSFGLALFGGYLSFAVLGLPLGSLLARPQGKEARR